MKKNEITILKQKLSAHKGKTLCVLADVSGSMAEINSAGLVKFAEMRDALTKGLAGRTDYTLLQFDSNTAHVASPADLWLSGKGTRLADALETARAMAPEHILIVTDGYPTDIPADSCLGVLDAHFPWVRVDVLFVGDEGDEWALKLLRAVARNGGELRTARKAYLGAVKHLLGERSTHNG